MLKKKLIRLHWLLSSQFGLDLHLLFRSLRGLPAFVSDWRKYRKAYSGKLTLRPCLHDRYAEGGSTKSEYFWQDLLVARWIFEAKPILHVDIGSRVDGFVAHVASFREIEVFDVRPITATVPGITFKQADLMQPDASLAGYCDSLSCLHALEHFGLGRYGDPVNPNGLELGLANMSRLLKTGGILYLSVPIGEDCVEFNAQRIIKLRSLLIMAKACGLRPSHLTVILPSGVIKEHEIDDSKANDVASVPPSLGIFIFTKTA